MIYVRSLWLALGLGLLSFAFGCDDSSGGGNENDGGGDASDSGNDQDGEDLDAGQDAEVEEPTLVEQLATTVCDAISNCPGQDFDLVYPGAVFGADCATELADPDSDVVIDEIYLARDFTRLQAAVEGGTVTFNEETFADCLAGLAACGGLDILYGPCDASFEGTVADGDACTISQECEDGYCNILADGCGGTCTGSSEPYVLTFEVVGEEDPCGSENTENGRNELLCPNGLACTGQVEGEGTYLGTCNTPIAAGEPCFDDSQCENGAVCWNGNSCETISVGELHDDCNMNYRQGSPTPEGDEVQYCNIWEGLDCIEDSCEVYTDGTEGSPCIPWIDHCNAGLSCSSNGDGYECTLIADNGDDCSSADGCTSGICDYELEQCLETCPVPD